MPKNKNYESADLNQEFDEIYKQIGLYVVNQTQPTNPRVGLQWFNPKTGDLSIWDGTQWIIK